MIQNENDVIQKFHLQNSPPVPPPGPPPEPLPPELRLLLSFCLGIKSENNVEKLKEISNLPDCFLLTLFLRLTIDKFQ